MFRFTKWMVAPVVAAALFFAADAPSAKAGGFSISIGNGYNGFGYQSYRPSYGYRGGYGYGSSFGNRAVIVAPHQSYYRPSYNTQYRGGHGHYDYHPTEVYRHGNHFDVVPGHYDYHRGSHFGHH